MTDEQLEELREQILSFFGESTGLAIGAFLILLVAAVIATSAIFLYLLRNRSPRVPIPEPRWGLAEVLLYFFGWYLLQFLLGTAVLQAFPPLPSSHVGTLLEVLVRTPLVTSAQIAASAISGLCIAGGVLCLPRLIQQPMSAIGIGTGSVARGVVQGVIVWLCFLPAGIAVALLWFFTLVLIGVKPESQPIVSIFRDSVGSGQWIPAATIFTLAIVVAPLVEELIFRVVIFRWISHRYGVGVGIASSGLLFGLIHGSILALVPITLLGALLAYLFHRTGNLWSCVALHATFNAGQLVLMVLEA